MRGQKNKVSVVAVRNANGRLVSKSGKSIHILSDDSKNGVVAFKAIYGGRTFDLNISKERIKDAYAKSVAETIL